MSHTEWDYNDREVLVKHPGEDWRVAVPSEIYCTIIAKRDDTALPFGHFRAEPFGWTDCAPDADGAKALYEHPPHDDTALLRQVLEAIDSLEKDVYGSFRPNEQAAVDALRERLK